MAKFEESRVVENYWDETLLDCRATVEGRRVMDEISMRLQGLSEAYGEFLSVNDAEKEYNLDIIDKGSSRIVINPNDGWVSGRTECIAKIQWDETFDQNSSEISKWEEMNGRKAALVAPILDHSKRNFWLIMPKAELTWGIDPDVAKEILNDLSRKMRQVGLTSGDVRRANIGRVEGRDVVIDYADFRVR